MNPNDSPALLNQMSHAIDQIELSRQFFGKASNFEGLQSMAKEFDVSLEFNPPPRPFHAHSLYGSAPILALCIGCGRPITYIFLGNHVDEFCMQILGEPYSPKLITKGIHYGFCEQCETPEYLGIIEKGEFKPIIKPIDFNFIFQDLKNPPKTIYPKIEICQLSPNAPHSEKTTLTNLSDLPEKKDGVLNVTETEFTFNPPKPNSI